MAVACPNCGATNPDRAAKCAICGTALMPRSTVARPAAPGEVKKPGPGTPAGRPGAPTSRGPASGLDDRAVKQEPPGATPGTGGAAAPSPFRQPAAAPGAQAGPRETRTADTPRPQAQQPSAPKQPQPAQQAQTQPQRPVSAPAGAAPAPGIPAAAQPQKPVGRLTSDTAVKPPSGPVVEKTKQAEPAAAPPAGPTEPAAEEKEERAAGETEVPRPPAEETGTWYGGWGWPYGETPRAYGWPAPYGGMQSYGGGPGGYPPWYPPYPMFGYPYPYPGMYFWPYMMPYLFPPYAMMPPSYGLPAQAPCTPHPAQPQPYVGVARKKKTRPLYVVLIILGLLVVVGGAVAAFLLLTGNTSATYRLGDGSVTGADIDFRDMVLKQSGEMLILTGVYDNNTKNEGVVIVTIQAISKGGEQLISFNVPVAPGTGRSLSQQKSAGSIKLSGATLSSLEYQGSTETTPSDEDYPWSSTPQQSTPSNSGTVPTYPFTAPENSQTYQEQNPYGSSPTPQDAFQTSPEISLPLPIY